MKRYVAVWMVLLLWSCLPASSATRVWGLYGFGDNIFGSSSGIDTIAAKARLIKGVTSVVVRDYWQTGEVASEIMAVPATDRIVIYGYSCGLNSATAIAAGVARTVNTVTGIQQSLWCGGTPLQANVDYGQSTYGGCIRTFGLGCKQLKGGPGFHGSIVNIRRPDGHGYADNDPDAQADVLFAIAETARGNGSHHLHVGHVRSGAQEIHRGFGERL